MIAWIDLETTGLDTECAIIEVACVVTDGNFAEVDRYYSEPLSLNGFPMIEINALEMHRKSGLWNLVVASNKTIMQADRELSSILSGYDSPILGGSSVHFDRGFIERWMPETKKCLHYRNLDVSTLKLFVSNAFDIPLESLPPLKSKTAHRAMDDIMDSIEAARWYRMWCLKAPDVSKFESAKYKGNLNSPSGEPRVS